MVDNINSVIFIIFSLLYAVGFYTGGYILIIAGGIILLGSTTTITLFTITWQNIVFALLLGIASIYHGVILIMQERK